MKSLKFIPLASMLILSTVANAGLDLAAIKAKAVQDNEAKALLQNPDPAIRKATIEAMLNSGDIAMKETAFAAGFDSDDDVVRSITLKKKFRDLQSLTFRVKLPSTSTEAQKKLSTKLGGALSYEVTDFKEDNGSLILKRGAKKLVGSLSGTVLSASYNSNASYTAALKLKLNDESKLVGVYVQKGTSLPVEADLY